MTAKRPPSTDSHNDPRLADVVGGAFALLQHGLDRAIDWGFQKMKAVEQSADPEKDIQRPWLKRAAKIGKGTIGFIADAGQAYYRSYEKLKREGAGGGNK